MTKPSLKRIGQIAACLAGAIFIAYSLKAMLDAQIHMVGRRTESDLRTLATALETYRLDNGRIPTEAEGLVALTTPVAYLTSIPTDVTGPERDSPLRYLSNGEDWIAIGRGPDREFDPALSSDLFVLPRDQALERLRQATFDPTNGSRSAGNIWRTSLLDRPEREREAESP